MPESQNQSPSTVPQGNELVPGEGNRNDGEAGKVSTTPQSSPAQPSSKDGQGELPKELDFVRKVTGRDYKSLEDAEKGLKETYNYVGSLGKQASVFDKLADKISKENSVEKEVAIQYLTDLVEAGQALPDGQKPEDKNVAPGPQDATPSKPTNLQDMNTKHLAEKVQELEFLRKNPEAEPQLDLIRKVYRATGEDFQQIYQDQIIPLINAGKKSAYETQDRKSANQTVVSGNEAPKVDSYSDTFEAWRRNPKQTSLAEVLKSKGLRIVAEE